MMEPEPETGDNETHVGYDDVEVKGMSCDDDETNLAADSDGNEQESDDTEIDNVVWTVELGGVASDADVSEDEREDFAVEEDVFDDEIEGFDAEEGVFENEMEIVGVEEGVSDAEEDDATARMILAEDESECDDNDEIARPVRRVRNVVDSDDDGEVAARAVHPPGTMAVFDELASGDIDNPCEIQIMENTVM